MNDRRIAWDVAPRWASHLPLVAIALTAVAAAGCGQAGHVTAKPTSPSLELVPVALADLSFTHDALRQRIQRIDRIMRGAGYPAAKTIDWSRRPASQRDGRKEDDFVAQWSTATDRLGEAIQPGDEPASTVQIYAAVDPKSAASDESPQIWRFHLNGSWRPKSPGWTATVVIFSYRPYTADAVGKETIRIHFHHTDDTTTLDPPFDAWQAATPMDPQPQPQRGFEQARIVCQSTDLSVAQARALTASPESFLEEACRLIDAGEARAMGDIQASRGGTRGSYRQVDNDGRVRFTPSDPKQADPLSAEEIQQFRGMAEKEFQRRRSLVKEHYQELHAAILKAFPLDQYVAEEPIPDAS